MVMEWLFGPRARRWQEVESVFFFFFFFLLAGKLKQ